jgi:hypothetical protein
LKDGREVTRVVRPDASPALRDALAQLA